MKSAGGMTPGFEVITSPPETFVRPAPTPSFSRRIGIILGLAALVVLDGCQ